TTLVLTIVLWALAIWLCWPALHAIGCWVVGADCVAPVGRFFVWAHYELVLIAVLTVATVGALIGWALIQRQRFRSKNRRRARPSVTVEQLARRHRLDPKRLEKWQRAQRLVVHYNDDGTVRRIRAGDAPAPADEPATEPLAQASPSAAPTATGAAESELRS
ncbi:MAG TPA: poly-beta-1,6-N-acetyl-D-glucosamine biosynthesis protein PgaD, partial [Burkholderiaceae bacterium]|nr:poly-beta-1,6-N-acetyl-D-glucosamine biosynthesis protein PgaD [Burkholderiaceae bacterium]